MLAAPSSSHSLLYRAGAGVQGFFAVAVDVVDRDPPGGTSVSTRLYATAGPPGGLQAWFHSAEQLKACASFMGCLSPFGSISQQP